MNNMARRFSYVFLCVFPFATAFVCGVRALRVPGFYQIAGVVWAGAFCVAAWILGARMMKPGAAETRQLAMTGTLLMTPVALMGLLWVGLGPPWEATPAENRMRYLVLVFVSIAITGGFVVLKDTLAGAGERLYSAPGFAAAMLAGAMYLVWLSFELDVCALKLRGEPLPASLLALSEMFEALLFVAGLLTYVATALFAAAMGQARWLGRNASRAYVLLNLVAVVFLVMRGVAFPDPKALSVPWYTQPGFIVGIPAMPWFMPFLLGVAVLRRAGDAASPSA